MENTYSEKGGVKMETQNMRVYDENGYVIPHCIHCMEELRVDDEVIVTHLFYVIHERCKKLDKWGELDKGLFSEVANRNRKLLSSFYKYFKKMGVYEKK